MGRVKVWNGSAWIEAKAKNWSGTQWNQNEMKIWDGTRWIYLTPGSFTSEYQAILNQAVALGYTLPTFAQQIEQDNLIHDLKAAGIWTKLDVFYNMVTNGDANFATLNWISPTTFQLTKPTAPTFTSNLGFTGNGTTQSLNTNWVPSTNGVQYTLNDSSIFCYWNSTTSTNNGIMFGAADTGAVHQTWLSSFSTSQLFASHNSDLGSTGLGSPSTNFLGLHSLERIASTGFLAYFNGGNYGGTHTQVSSALPGVSMTLLAYHNAGSITLFNAGTMGMFGAGASLGASLQLTLNKIYNTYLANL